MDATTGYKRLHAMLSVTQENVIDRLVSGDTDQQAADAVGVHRTSVTRWRLYHPTFQAALNERRQHVFGSAVDKLRSLTHRALDTLAAKMDEGNVLAAVTILKAAALDKLPPPAGPTDPEQMFQALVDARMAEKRERRKRSMTLSDELDELSNPGRLARWEAEHTAAAQAEIEAELDAKLNGARQAETDAELAAQLNGDGE